LPSKFCQLDSAKLAAVPAKFTQLEADGIMHCSSSPWLSPLHMVKKSNGSWRQCGDFRCFNLVKTPDEYPLPNMMDFATS
jgi:hypothetical protein